LTFTRPSEAGRAKFGPKMAELEGSLVLFEPTKFIEQDTRWTNGAADTVETDLVVLEGPAVLEGRPKEHGAFYQAAIVRVLRENVGGMVLGRVTRGQAKGGKSAAFLLQDPSTEDEQVADAWLSEQEEAPF